MQAQGMQAKPAQTSNLLALPDGTELVGDFRIKRVLGAGGFGITYLADETALARLVTIKEYFPADLAARQQNQSALPRSQDVAGDYQWGLDRFIDEAQVLARFDHPNIVRVHRYFRANNTAYMVLHFEEGGSFKSWLKGLKRAPRQAELDRMIAPMLDALEIIHKDNFLHRDIAPDNIMVRKDGSPVLIDFGSARGHIAAHSRTVSALVKPGYSPYEQYATTTSSQGPWTDIYALGATLYHAITGKRPPDSPSRVVDDEYVPAREAALGSYRSGFLAAVDQALKVEVDERPQSVAQWRGALLAPDEKREPGKLGLRLPIVRTLRRLREAAMPQAAGAAAPAPVRAAPAPADPTLVVTTPPAAAEPAALVPAPPDAPQPKGQLLDFIAALRKHRPSILAPSRKRKKAARQTDAEASESAAPAPAKPSPPAQAKGAQAQAARVATAPPFGLGYGPPPVSAPADAAAPKAKAKRAARAIPKVLQRRAPPKPRRGWRLPSRRWRSVLGKVAAAVAIAGLAVAYQESLPRSAAKTEKAGPSQSAGIPATLRLVGHAGGVVAAAASDEGRWIVSAGTDSTLKIWNSSSGALVRTVALDGAPSALAVDDQRALTGHKGGTIVLWDLERAEKIATFQHGSGTVAALAFGGDDTFAAVGQDGSVALFNIRTPASQVVLLDGRDGGATLAVAANDRDLLATAGPDRTVRLWRTPAATLARSYRSNGGDITAIAISPDGRRQAAAAADGAVRVWHNSSSRPVNVLRGGEGRRIAALAFGPEGTLAAAGEDGRVTVWRLDRSRIDRTLDGGPLRALSFSPSGRQLIGAGNDGVVRVWVLTGNAPSAKASL